MKEGAPEKLIENGKRLDGRGFMDMRPMTLDVNIVKNAIGSAMFAFGDTKAIAGVYGPKPYHPKHFQDPQKAILKCKYSMVPFSTRERIRPGISRRGTEITKVITEAFASVIFFEDFPKTGIDVFIDVLQADASTRCAGLNAASLALADAGIPMRELVSSCSVGKIDNTIVLDMFGTEDNFGDVDLALAFIGREDKIVLMQMDGIVTKDELMKMIEIGKEGCFQIHDRQKETLREKYFSGDNNE